MKIRCRNGEKNGKKIFFSKNYQINLSVKKKIVTLHRFYGKMLEIR